MTTLLPGEIPVYKPRRSLRVVAFCAVAFSTVSVLSCVITLPIVYSHVQSVQSFMQSEVDFCKVGYKIFSIVNENCKNLNFPKLNHFCTKL